MSTSERRQQPIIDDSDTDSDDGRAVIVAAKETPKFKHGQVVYIKASAVGPRDGPYKIERVISKAKFTLCDISTSMTAKDGKEFDADELET